MPIAPSFGSMAAKAVLPSIGENVGSKKALVLVHGAGRFVAGDYDPVVKHVEDSLGTPVNCFKVLYSDVLNQPPGTVAAAAAAPTPEALKVQADMENELARDAFARAIDAVPSNQLLSALVSGVVPGGNSLLAAFAALLRGPQAGDARTRLINQIQRAFPGLPLADWVTKLTSAATTGGIDVSATVQQVAQYLAQDEVRPRMQAPIIAALDQATANFDEVVLASHSLGSIITFDILHDRADTYHNISHWFTLGCPLLKVQRLGHRTELGKIGYDNVKHWFNVYDTTDIIANALGPGFSKPEYLMHDIFIDIGSTPLPSHDYYNNPDTLDLIAAAMR